MNTTFLKTPFIERLGTEPLVTDGSMAIELARKGCMEFPPDVYNIKNPVSVENIYRDFLNAGADILQTNTEFSNRYALEKYSLADKVYEINRKGVWLTRMIALQGAYVAGVVGPTGKFFKPLGTLTADDARMAFTEQIIALVDGGADVLFLKSFIDIDELCIAIEAAQFVSSTIPIIAMKTFPEDGSVLATSFPEDIARRLKSYGVAAIGANGTVGPLRMLDIMTALNENTMPLISLPDIGIPTLLNGKPIYNAEPEYVANVLKRIVESGTAIIGAHGGASVEHIRAIATAVKSLKIGSVRIEVKPHKNTKPEEVLKDERSEFGKNLGKKFLATVELDIPRGLDMDSVFEGAQFLKEKGLDAVNISDGARARLRMSPIAISHLTQAKTGMEAIMHLSCRDRNMVGLQAELLGAYALGVRNILAVTGDPAQIGDYPYATSVYDVDSIGLIRALHRMNNGQDLAGNPIGAPTQFTICCACNPAADDMDREIARLEEKAAEGAHVAFSQPIFDMKMLESFRKRTQHINIHFLLGIIPLRTARHAEFLHYEVPGMSIPEWVRKRMHSTGTSVEAASREGIAITVEFLKEASASVDGAYLMPPFKKYSMAVEILQQL
ncbi:MAG: bifunctional homocysteine S-methyltransferase/methylenetetrahydrofolate reductase [Bacteroidota bacterium]